MRAFNYIAILFFILLSGCAVHELAPADYMQWVKDEENGLHVSKRMGDHIFSLQYKPSEFEALLHMKNNEVSRLRLNQATASMNELQYYTFCISSPGKKDPAASAAVDDADYNQRLNYLMFDMQNDFMLIDGKDTLTCAFYHYERNFNVSPDNNILLGFEQVNTSNQIQDKTILYDDHLLETGAVLLTIKAEDLKSVPTLKLNN